MFKPIIVIFCNIFHGNPLEIKFIVENALEIHLTTTQSGDTIPPVFVSYNRTFNYWTIHCNVNSTNSTTLRMPFNPRGCKKVTGGLLSLIFDTVATFSCVSTRRYIIDCQPTSIAESVVTIR